MYLPTPKFSDFFFLGWDRLELIKISYASPYGVMVWLLATIEVVSQTCNWTRKHSCIQKQCTIMTYLFYLKGEVRNRKEVMYIEYYHKSNHPNILLLPWRKLQSLVINLRPLLSSSWPPLPNSVWKTSQSRYAKIIKVLWGVLLKPHFSNWSKSLTWRIIWVAYVFIIF